MISKKTVVTCILATAMAVSPSFFSCRSSQAHAAGRTLSMELETPVLYESDSYDDDHEIRTLGITDLEYIDNFNNCGIEDVEYSRGNKFYNSYAEIAEYDANCTVVQTSSDAMLIKLWTDEYGYICSVNIVVDGQRMGSGQSNSTNIKFMSAFFSSIWALEPARTFDELNEAMNMGSVINGESAEIVFYDKTLQAYTIGKTMEIFITPYYEKEQFTIDYDTEFSDGWQATVQSYMKNNLGEELGYMVEDGTAYFLLQDLDGNGVPEVILLQKIDGSGHMSCSNIYTVGDGELVEALTDDVCGEEIIAYADNYFEIDGYMQDGSCTHYEYTNVYRMESGVIEPAAKFRLGYEESDTPNRWSIDGEEVSESEYENRYNEIMNGLERVDVFSARCSLSNDAGRDIADAIEAYGRQ